MNNKKVIVTTTIYSPSKALQKYFAMKDWTVIVIGDLKTPHKEYKNIKNIIYLGPEEQDKKYPKLSEAIGWNKIMRRNIGFIEAYNMGAEIIASIDDDNIPYDFWGKEIMIDKEVEVTYYETDEICFDPMAVTNYPHLWHRGFPLQLLLGRKYSKSKKKVFVDIQSDFWDGNPDIDAMCRFIYDPICLFKKEYFPFTSNTFSPFNSQNTFLPRRLLKDYFVFPYVGRMDDIWASYYVQSKGYNIVYGRPTVCQERNIQDTTINMRDEYDGYLNNEKLLKAIKNNPENIKQFMKEENWIAFQEYKKLFN